VYGDQHLTGMDEISAENLRILFAQGCSNKWELGCFCCSGFKIFHIVFSYLKPNKH